MFEIDENTKYSLRILGRGSVIVVSVALILAIIGYFHRDGQGNQKGKIPDVILAEQFIQIAKSPGEMDFKGRKINIQGTVDSVAYNAQKTTAFIFSDTEKVLEFELNTDSDNLQKKQKVIFSGEYKGKSNGTFQFDKCTFKKQ